MPYIFYLPDEQLVEVEPTELILEASLRAGIPHIHACGGNARCSTCRVLISEGLEYCTPSSPEELALTDRLHFNPAIRLACQTQIIGTGRVTLRRLALDTEDLEMINDQVSGRIEQGAIGEEKKIAILFADIRGFTTFSEQLLPYDVVYVLNRYFQRMGYVINRHGGIINNYMGDGLMALFGLDNPDRAAERAVRAGLDMLEAVEKLNPYFEMLYHQRFRIGVGIHYGYAVIGAVGAVKDKNITAIGDAVNFASRIEAANKKAGSNLLISAETYAEVQDHVILNRVIAAEIPGKSGQYQLYEIVGMTTPDTGLAYRMEPSRKSWIQWLFQQLQNGLAAIARRWRRGLTKR